MAASMTIDGRPIGPDHPPYVVAELSANHNGSLDQALAIMEAIKAASADAVKLQTYTADTMTLDHDGPDFHLTEGPWAGHSLYELYQWAHTPWEWHEALFAKGPRAGHHRVLQPVRPYRGRFSGGLRPARLQDRLLRAGRHPADRIRRQQGPADDHVHRHGQPRRDHGGGAGRPPRRLRAALPAALHLGLPNAPPEEADLRTIPDLAQRFDVVPGLSDHTLSPAVPVAAVALGACVIEEHVTMRRADGGPDADFSLEPDELSNLVTQARIGWQALGEVRKQPKPSEDTQRPLRRSLYAAKDIKAGEILGHTNLRAIRPGYGLSPRNLPTLIGRQAAVDIPRGTPLAWEKVM